MSLDATEIPWALDPSDRSTTSEVVSSRSGELTGEYTGELIQTRDIYSHDITLASGLPRAHKQLFSKPRIGGLKLVLFRHQRKSTAKKSILRRKRLF
jgi:hypothetical protein